MKKVSGRIPRELGEKFHAKLEKEDRVQSITLGKILEAYVDKVYIEEEEE